MRGVLWKQGNSGIILDAFVSSGQVTGEHCMTWLLTEQSTESLLTQPHNISTV